MEDDTGPTFNVFDEDDDVVVLDKKLPFLYQKYENGVVPFTETVKEVEPPDITVWFGGWEEIVTAVHCAKAVMPGNKQMQTK